jgi:hypothetical protein
MPSWFGKLLELLHVLKQRYNNQDIMLLWLLPEKELSEQSYYRRFSAIQQRR